MAFTVVYDACVLYPVFVRDSLVRLAQLGLFRAKWTDRILDEMVDNILANRSDLTRPQLERTRHLMCEAVRDCLVTNYESLIDGLTLPDPNDRQVLAAAIRSGSQVIVTENLRHFPSEALEPFDIEAQSVDTFVQFVIDLNPDAVIEALRRQAAALRTPITLEELLDALKPRGLEHSVADLRSRLA